MGVPRRTKLAGKQQHEPNTDVKWQRYHSGAATFTALPCEERLVEVAVLLERHVLDDRRQLVVVSDQDDTL